MQTKIIIEHKTVEALKASPLWEQLMALMFSDGAVSVVEVGKIDEQE
jgi:hypothetical protein